MVGIEWEGSNSIHFFEQVTDFGGGPILSYSDFADSGWFGFNTVMHIRVLGVRLVRFYVNGTDHTPFKWAGLRPSRRQDSARSGCGYSLPRGRSLP